MTLLFSLDFLVRRWTGDGVSLSPVRRSGWGWIVVDLLAALPLGLMLQLPAIGLLRLTKLLRVIPLVGGLRHNVSLHPTVLRLGVFLFGLTISTHWLACGWLRLKGPGSSGRHYI